MSTNALGRRVPTDFRHFDRYPLSALPWRERPTYIPMPIGINWYPEFDRPYKGEDKRWRVSVPAPRSRPRGGHCVCLQPAGTKDLVAWWLFYNQGQEGACVGEGCSRTMTLLNRKRYDPFWNYRQAQLIDEWEDTPPEEGTSVRAGLEVLRTIGPRPVRRLNKVGEPSLADGISAYRWATNMQDVLTTLGMPSATEVPVLNSWGRSYPHVVWFPVEALLRVQAEDGEFGVVTDN